MRLWLAGAAGNIFEFAIHMAHQQERLQVAQSGLGLLDVVHNMALSYEQILPAVLIVVDGLCPPSRMARRDSAETCRASEVDLRLAGHIG